MATCFCIHSSIYPERQQRAALQIVSFSSVSQFEQSPGFFPQAGRPRVSGRARRTAQKEQAHRLESIIHDSCPDSRRSATPRPSPLPFGPTGARFHLSQNSLEMAMENSNGFASYSVEPTPSPTAATLTLAPTYDENFSTPYPTYDQGDQGYYDDDDMTPLMRAYATIGFIIRIFLPIILIVMCCRLKRRGEFADGLGGVGGGGRAQDGGFVSGETRMDPEERKRYVEERLCSKVREFSCPRMVCYKWLQQ